MAAVSYTAPFAPTLPAPVGFDAEIQRLQLALAAELSWLAVSYGRATRGGKKQGNKLITFPEVYHGNGEYRDVLPNDNVAAQSFFYPRDPATNLADEPGPSVGLRMDCDLIFWCNLKKIDPTKPYRFEAELLQDVLRVLNQEGGVLIKRVFTSAEEVYRGFSVDTVDEQFLRHPFCGFRIQLELHVLNMLC